MTQKYGHFSQDGHEFVITEPKLPSPWINFLTNKEYCAVISHTAGGYSFYKDCKTERLLHWLGPDLRVDRPGRYVFVRDNESGEVFSITWQPLRKKLDEFSCRVGLGYQVISSSYKEIKGEITYFVPRSEPCEIWKLVITNNSSKNRNLSLFGYVEWLLGNTVGINFHNIAILYNRANFDNNAKAIFAKKTVVFGEAVYEQMPIAVNPQSAFFGSSAKIDGWDCHKQKFLGKYNTEETPESVFRGKCTQSFCEGDEAVGVLQHNIALSPGESKTIVFILGIATEENAKKLLNKYRNTKNVDEELEAVKKFWLDKFKNSITIRTPDPDLDLMINIWVKYQLFICNQWSRSPSYYHEGQGGRGYRDSCQDSEAVLPLDIEYAREKMLKIVRLIRRDGTCAPGWSDTYGPFPQKPYKDHPVWLTYSIHAYVRESGDVGFLNQKVPWLKDMWIEGGTKVDPNVGRRVSFEGEGTIFEHLLAQLNYTYNDVSHHGIPRIGEADWNDAFDMAGRKGVGESVWIAMALVRSLKMLSQLAELIGKKDVAEDLLKKADGMTNRINKIAWDGAWYVRGFNDDGEAFGSSKNKEGKIYLNTQSWAILSGVAPEDRIKKLLRSVDTHLECDFGLALFAPVYTKVDTKLGRITAFARGTKENAAVFCHAHTFMVAGDCLVGRGDIAYRRMCEIMPNKKDPDVYCAEPYVYAEYLVGPSHPYERGRGMYTWLTGTAGWIFKITTQHILGAYPDFDGLRIDPCIPSSWKTCEIRRPFRGATYDITVENPHGVQKGVKEVYVDGEKIDGNLIRPHKDGKIHKVRVVMG